MKSSHFYLLFYVLLLTTKLPVNAFEPITTTAALVGGVGVVAYFCHNHGFFYETCGKKWTNFNATGLKSDLDFKLFGQHIASRTTLRAVTEFMSNDNPKKALVLFLHGPTGTGKNLVSQLIAENIYKKGMDSSFVHLFIASHHFPHRSEIDTYKSQLQKWIRGNVTKCERSMFIFDEMDKMNSDLIDSIRPYLDAFDNLGGVSYRKAIFIFLSNAGAQRITETALQFWNDKRYRGDIELKHLETSIPLAVFNNRENHLFHTTLADNLVDFFIPFLPLEHQHVIQCGMAVMRARGLKPNRDVAKKMADDLVYYPTLERGFSSVGCKTIQSKIHYYM